MVELINDVYTELQHLQLQPTKHNVEILARCFGRLEEIARRYAGGETGGPETDGPETDGAADGQDPDEDGAG